MPIRRLFAVAGLLLAFAAAAPAAASAQTTVTDSQQLLVQGHRYACQAQGEGRFCTDTVLQVGQQDAAGYNVCLFLTFDTFDAAGDLVRQDADGQCTTVPASRFTYDAATLRSARLLPTVIPLGSDDAPRPVTVSGTWKARGPLQRETVDETSTDGGCTTTVTGETRTRTGKASMTIGGSVLRACSDTSLLLVVRRETTVCGH